MRRRAAGACAAASDRRRRRSAAALPTVSTGSSRPHGCYLDLVGYRLHGNVRRRDDNTPLLDVEVSGCSTNSAPNSTGSSRSTGAPEAIAAMTPLLEVVVLSNVTELQALATPAQFRGARARAAARVNSGPKGPAVWALARRSGRPVFFVDDIPQHLASVAEAAPEVFRIHLIGDDRLKPLCRFRRMRICAPTTGSRPKRSSSHILTLPLNSAPTSIGQPLRLRKSEQTRYLCTEDLTGRFGLILHPLASASGGGARVAGGGGRATKRRDQRIRMRATSQTSSTTRSSTS